MTTTTAADDPALARLRAEIRHAGRHLANPFYNPDAFGDELGRAVGKYRAAVAEEIAEAIEQHAADNLDPDGLAYQQAQADAVIARRIGAAT